MTECRYAEQGRFGLYCIVLAILLQTCDLPEKYEIRRIVREEIAAACEVTDD